MRAPAAHAMSDAQLAAAVALLRPGSPPPPTAADAWLAAQDALLQPGLTVRVRAHGADGCRDRKRRWQRARVAAASPARLPPPSHALPAQAVGALRPWLLPLLSELARRRESPAAAGAAAPHSQLPAAAPAPAPAPSPPPSPPLGSPCWDARCAVALSLLLPLAPHAAPPAWRLLAACAPPLASLLAAGGGGGCCDRPAAAPPPPHAAAAAAPSDPPPQPQRPSDRSVALAARRLCALAPPAAAPAWPCAGPALRLLRHADPAVRWGAAAVAARGLGLSPQGASALAAAANLGPAEVLEAEIADASDWAQVEDARAAWLREVRGWVGWGGLRGRCGPGGPPTLSPASFRQKTAPFCQAGRRHTSVAARCRGAPTAAPHSPSLLRGGGAGGP